MLIEQDFGSEKMMKLDTVVLKFKREGSSDWQDNLCFIGAYQHESLIGIDVWHWNSSLLSN